MLKTGFSLLVLLAFLCNPVDAQKRNYNADLDTEGSLDELSPHPDGSIWVTTNDGFSYRAAAFDSLWYPYLMANSEGDSIQFFDRPLKRVTWFDDKTGIATGDLSEEKTSERNILYRTTDAGKSWSLVKFGDACWVYNVHTQADGKAWLTGSSGKIYYTENYGADWKTLKRGFDNSDRSNRVFMTSATAGMVAGSNNKLQETADNFQTWTSIETPVDQEIVRSKSFSNSVSELIHFNGYWIVLQTGRLFFTKDTEVKWDTTTQKLNKVAFDQKNNRLFALDDSGYVYLIEDAMRVRKIQLDQRIKESRTDVRAHNQQLLVLDGHRNLHVIDDLGWKTHPLHTDHYPIPIPEVIRSTKDSSLLWGLNKRHIFQSADTGSTWFRAISLDFNASTLKAMSDNQAIAGNGKGKNYRVDVEKQEFELYDIPDPLADFLESPIVEMRIVSVSGASNSVNQMEMVYKLDVDQQLTMETFSNGSALELDSDKEIELWMPSKDPEKLVSILKGVSANPESMPNIKEFVILDYDIERYLESINNKKAKKAAKKSESKKKELDFKVAAVSRLDTVSKGTLKPALESGGMIFTTIDRSMSLVLVNEAGQTMEIKNGFFLSPSAWHLPWTVTVEDYAFRTYSLDVSRWVMDVTPQGFHYRWHFNNTLLVERIINLWYREEYGSGDELMDFLQLFSK